jgi:hypothetical protein
MSVGRSCSKCLVLGPADDHFVAMVGAGVVVDRHPRGPQVGASDCDLTFRPQEEAHIQRQDPVCQLNLLAQELRLPVQQRPKPLDRRFEQVGVEEFNVEFAVTDLKGRR